MIDRNRGHASSVGSCRFSRHEFVFAADEEPDQLVLQRLALEQDFYLQAITDLEFQRVLQEKDLERLVDFVIV
jgi:hypothetical protein